MTIRTIENERIVPAEYDGAADRCPLGGGERNQDVGVRSPWSVGEMGARLRLIYLKHINIQRANELAAEGGKEYII